MRPLFFTLAAEGSTDEMLLPVVSWALREHLGPTAALNESFSYHRGDIAPRIERALREFPDSEVLFLHVDADSRAGHQERIRQIERAVEDIASARNLPHLVRIIPVRESEAWLLFSETAIRAAAANPNGRAKLNLPSRDHDRVADPKQMLNDALDKASELTGRKLAKFQRDRRPIWVAECIDDFSLLRRLEAFLAFERELSLFAVDWLTRLGTAEGG